jgi:hypothetical protein
MFGRNGEPLNTARLPDQDALTVQDFSEILGWLIIKTQEGGVDVRDQITVLQLCRRRTTAVLITALLVS